MESAEELFLSGILFSSTLRSGSLPASNRQQSRSLGGCASLAQAVEETLPGQRALARSLVCRSLWGVRRKRYRPINAAGLLLSEGEGRDNLDWTILEVASNSRICRS